jgi:hypothetical protein
MDEERGRQAAEDLTNFLNSADSRDVAAFVEAITKRSHRTLQQRAFHAFGKCIEQWKESWSEHEYDPRNEHTCEVSASIVYLLGEHTKFYKPFDTPTI